MVVGLLNGLTKLGLIDFSDLSLRDVITIIDGKVEFQNDLIDKFPILEKFTLGNPKVQDLLAKKVSAFIDLIDIIPGADDKVRRKVVDLIFRLLNCGDSTSCFFGLLANLLTLPLFSGERKAWPIIQNYDAATRPFNWNFPSTELVAFETTLRKGERLRLTGEWQNSAAYATIAMYDPEGNLLEAFYPPQAEGVTTEGNELMIEFENDKSATIIRYLLQEGDGRLCTSNKCLPKVFVNDEEVGVVNSVTRNLISNTLQEIFALIKPLRLIPQSLSLSYQVDQLEFQTPSELTISASIFEDAIADRKWALSMRGTVPELQIDTLTGDTPFYSYYAFALGDGETRATDSTISLDSDTEFKIWFASDSDTASMIGWVEGDNILLSESPFPTIVQRTLSGRAENECGEENFTGFIQEVKCNPALPIADLMGTAYPKIAGFILMDKETG